jgi:hypothetical protein
MDIYYGGKRPLRSGGIPEMRRGKSRGRFLINQQSFRPAGLEKAFPAVEDFAGVEAFFGAAPYEYFPMM